MAFILEMVDNGIGGGFGSIMGFLIGYQKGTSGGNYGPFSVSVTGYMVLGVTAATAMVSSVVFS